MAEPYVPLGEIVATHGLAGWVRFNPLNPNSDTLSSGLEVYLDIAGVRSKYGIETVQQHGKQLLIKLHGVDHIDRARLCVGAKLLVEDTALAALKEGEYYQYQVIGFEVVDTTGKKIGKLVSTLSTAAGELYVVEGSSGEHLIPAVKDIVERVDFIEKRIIIDPPEGLLDL
jgi:16S rRNA processing protein RimM